MDWDKYNAAVEDLRQEKEADLRTEEPQYISVYRCTETPDLLSWI